MMSEYEQRGDVRELDEWVDEMLLRRPILKGATRMGKRKIFLASRKGLSLGTNWTRCVQLRVTVADCCERGMKKPRNVTMLNTAIRVNSLIARMQRAVDKSRARADSRVGDTSPCPGAPTKKAVEVRECEGGREKTSARAASRIGNRNLCTSAPDKKAVGVRQCEGGREKRSGARARADHRMRGTVDKSRARADSRVGGTSPCPGAPTEKTVEVQSANVVERKFRVLFGENFGH